MVTGSDEPTPTVVPGRVIRTISQMRSAALCGTILTRPEYHYAEFLELVATVPTNGN